MSRRSAECRRLFSRRQKWRTDLQFAFAQEAQFNFNHPDAVEWERLLELLAARQSAPDAPAILIVEGLMVLHVAVLRERLDVRVFVELEADVRALRRLLRDMQGGRVSSDPQFIAAYYLESARVGHEAFVEPSRVHADLIVRGDADPARVVPLLAAIIAAQVDESRK